MFTATILIASKKNSYLKTPSQLQCAFALNYILK